MIRLPQSRRHPGRAALAAVGLALALWWLPGCRRAAAVTPAGGYERVHGQILVAALAAIHDGDAPLAIARLEQLRALNPGADFVHQLLLQEKAELAVAEMNATLARGDTTAARARLARAVAEAGRTPRLRRLQDQLAGLEAIRAYPGIGADTTADDAAAALTKLPPPELLDHRPAYVAWFATVQRQADALRTAERQRLGGEVLDELDRALVTNASLVPALMAELQALDPQQPVLTRQHDAPAQLAGLDDLVVDLVCLRQARGPDRDRRAAILKFCAGRQPHSLAGMYLAAWSALVGGDTVTALAGLRALQELAPPLDLTPLQADLQRRLQEAAPDRPPNVPDLLEQLYRLPATAQ